MTRRGAFRGSGIVVGSLVLSACGSVGASIEAIPYDIQQAASILVGGAACAPGKVERIRKANWEEARTVSIAIRQSEFEPMVISLRQDRPYVFRFTNRDDNSHTFLAREFFAAVAVAKAPGHAPLFTTAGAASASRQIEEFRDAVKEMEGEPKPAAAEPAKEEADKLACAISLSALSIPPRTTVEVQFVAMRDGRYDFEDTRFFVPGSIFGGTSGVIEIR